MKSINLKFNIPDDSNDLYCVKIERRDENGELNVLEKQIDSTRKKITFLASVGETRISIEQITEPYNGGVLMNLFRLLTLPIRGMLNGIFLNSETDWENKVCPYCIKSDITLNISENEIDKDIETFEYEINLHKSKLGFDKEGSETFVDPAVDISPLELVEKVENDKIDNEDDIDAHFKHCIWRIYSPLASLLVIFAISIYCSIFKNANIVGSVIFGVVIMVMFGVVIYVNYRQTKKRIRLFEIFRNKKDNN